MVGSLFIPSLHSSLPLHTELDMLLLESSVNWNCRVTYLRNITNFKLAVSKILSRKHSWFWSDLASIRFLCLILFSAIAIWSSYPYLSLSMGPRKLQAGTLQLTGVEASAHQLVVGKFQIHDWKTNDWCLSFEVASEIAEVKKRTKLNHNLSKRL